MTSKEVWKDIAGYEGIYQVSNKGYVRNITKKPHRVLKNFADKKGYLMVKLYKNGTKSTKKVHRLVAFAFIPLVEGKTQINHIDGDKQNNVVENLEWADNSDNQKHSFKYLGKVATWKGKSLPMSTREKIRNYHLTHGGVGGKEVLCIDTGERYINACAASRDTGIHRSCISKVCRGVHKVAGGMRWQYV